VITAQSVRAIPSADGPPEPELVRIRDMIYQTAGIFHPDNSCIYCRIDAGSA